MARKRAKSERLGDKMSEREARFRKWNQILIKLWMVWCACKIVLLLRFILILFTKSFLLLNASILFILLADLLLV